MKQLLLVLGGLAVFAGCQSTSPQVGRTADTQTVETATAGAAPLAILHVEGMSCPLCASNIDKQLLDVRGVEDVVVNLGTGEVRATLSSERPPTREQLTTAIVRSGFTLSRLEMPGDRTGGMP
jgi:copper chaperone CopZ